MRHRPAWRARHKAQAVLQREAIDLIDHAVDVVAEPRAHLLNPPVMRDEVVRRMAEHHKRIDWKPEFLERRDHAHWRRGRQSTLLAPGVGEEMQRPPGGDGGIELA